MAVHMGSFGTKEWLDSLDDNLCYPGTVDALESDFMTDICGILCPEQDKDERKQLVYLDEPQHTTLSKCDHQEYYRLLRKFKMCNILPKDNQVGLKKEHSKFMALRQRVFLEQLAYRKFAYDSAKENIWLYNRVSDYAEEHSTARVQLGRKEIKHLTQVYNLKAAVNILPNTYKLNGIEPTFTYMNGFKRIGKCRRFKKGIRHVDLQSVNLPPKKSKWIRRLSQDPNLEGLLKEWKPDIAITLSTLKYLCNTNLDDEIDFTACLKTVTVDENVEHKVLVFDKKLLSKTFNARQKVEQYYKALVKHKLYTTWLDDTCNDKTDCSKTGRSNVEEQVNIIPQVDGADSDEDSSDDDNLVIDLSDTSMEPFSKVLKISELSTIGNDESSLPNSGSQQTNTKQQHSRKIATPNTCQTSSLNDTSLIQKTSSATHTAEVDPCSRGFAVSSATTQSFVDKESLANNNSASNKAYTCSTIDNTAIDQPILSTGLPYYLSTPPYTGMQQQPNSASTPKEQMFSPPMTRSVHKQRASASVAPRHSPFQGHHYQHTSSLHVGASSSNASGIASNDLIGSILSQSDNTKQQEKVSNKSPEVQPWVKPPKYEAYPTEPSIETHEHIDMVDIGKDVNKSYSYSLWHLGELKMLVRCGSHGDMPCHQEVTNKRVIYNTVVKAKVEYQKHLGYEKLTHLEACSDWLDLMMRPKPFRIMRYRLCAFEKKLINCDQVKQMPDPSFRLTDEFNPTVASRRLYIMCRKAVDAVRDGPCFADDYIVSVKPTPAGFVGDLMEIKIGLKNRVGEEERLANSPEFKLKNSYANIGRLLISSPDNFPYVDIDPNRVLVLNKLPMTFAWSESDKKKKKKKKGGPAKAKATKKYKKNQSATKRS